MDRSLTNLSVGRPQRVPNSLLYGLRNGLRTVKYLFAGRFKKDFSKAKLDLRNATAAKRADPINESLLD
jgi:hypothetical protein